MLLRSQSSGTPSRTATVLGWLAWAAFVGGIGAASTVSAKVAIAGAVLALGTAVFWRDVSLLALLAIPGLLLAAFRAPSLNISYTDIIGAAAGAAALGAGLARQLQPAARLLWGAFAFYLGMLLVSLSAHHNIHADLEWVHRVGLVGASALAGAWLVRSGRHRAALRLLVFLVGMLSIAAVVYSIAHRFAPAYVPGFQKNFTGSLCASTLLVLLAARSELRWRPAAVRTASVVILAGLAASQSRGGMLALVVGGMVWLFRARSHAPGSRRWLAAVVGLSLVLTIAVTVVAQVQSSNKFNSVHARDKINSASLQLWRENPITGVGLRFWYEPPYAGSYSPPNDEIIGALAESGVPGLIGLLAFVAGSLIALARARGPLALLGMSVVASRFAHGLVDLYWVSGYTTLPWILAGMALAIPPTAEEESQRQGGESVVRVEPVAPGG